MKNVFILLMVLAVIAGASAQYAPDTWGFAAEGAGNPYPFDGDGLLTDQDPDVWGTWGDGDVTSSDADITVSGGLCTFVAPVWELAFSHDNAIQDIGNPIPGVDDIEVILTVVSVDGGYVTMKIECYDNTDAFPNDDNGEGSIEIYDFEAAGITYTGPGVYTFNTSDPALSNAGPIPADTVAVTPVITVSGGPSTVVLEEIWIGKAGTYSTTKATNPSPSDGDVVGAGSVTELSWTNPDPNNLADDITCDVFILDGGEAPLPEDPNLYEGNSSGATQLANNQAITSIELPFWFPIEDGHYYYWAVNCSDTGVIDPNTGEPVETRGDVWMFNAGDAAPVVDAGPDQFMWLAQDDSDLDDGENNPNVKWFKVVGTYTDDGKSEITDANFVNLNWGWDPDGGEFGIIEVSDVHDSDANSVTAIYKTVYAEGGDPNVSTAIPGYWDIQLQVTDASGTASDVSYHRIDEDCTAAAEADASDDFDTTYDAVGNRNCKNDLADFAAFAVAWLDESVKFE